MSRAVLVTGAAGFIGSHTVEALLRRGEPVIGIDNLNPYYGVERKRGNLDEVFTTAASSPGTFNFIEGDIRDRALLHDIFERYTPRAVAHLAAMPGVGASVADPHLYYEVNLIGTLNLLEAARLHGKANFVFGSTSSTYGTTRRIPFSEDDPSDRPLAPYPASKRSAELLGHSYHHLHGMDFCALRFFTVYGPRGRPDMLAFRALEHLHRGTRLALYRNGEAKRDWTFVSDIVAGIVAAIDKRLGYQIINVGRGAPISVAEFMQILERQCSMTARVHNGQLPDSDMEITYASIDKARKLLGYQPAVSLEEGIALTLAWYRKQRLPLTADQSGSDRAT